MIRNNSKMTRTVHSNFPEKIKTLVTFTSPSLSCGVLWHWVRRKPSRVDKEGPSYLIRLYYIYLPHSGIHSAPGDYSGIPSGRDSAMCPSIVQ